MFENITMAGMQTQTINNAGMTFGIIYNYIMAAAQHINEADHSLVTVVQQYRIFFVNEGSEFSFQLFMQVTVATHHAGAHGLRQSIFFSSIGIRFSYFRMIGKAEIIVQAPYNNIFATEFHAAVYISFQFWKSKVAMGSFTMLADRPVMFQ